MTAILFQPHSDDACLFASFLCLRYQPRVITVLRSVKQQRQGVTQEEREAEDRAAFGILGVPMFEQWPEPDVNPDWEAIERMMRELPPVDKVFAPLPEENGNDQHNMVGMLAGKIFSNVRFYSTYVNSRSRSNMGQEVETEDGWIALKLQALACYQSQHRLWSTAHHFLGPQREFLS